MSITKVGIIGGGVAGLTVGSYLQMNGFQTEIYEQAAQTGGLCAAWERKGYLFDNTIHWMSCANKNDVKYKYFQELKAFAGVEIDYYELITLATFPNGTRLNVYCDSKKLETELIKHFPQDQDVIIEMCEGVRYFYNNAPPVNAKPVELLNENEQLEMRKKYQGYYEHVQRWGRITVKEFQQRLKNPIFRKNFTSIFKTSEKSSMFTLLITLFWFDKRGQGNLVNGSGRFIGNITNTYKKLGGKLHLNNRIEKIITEGNQVKGIVTQNGWREYDYVISACDAYHTFYNLLPQNKIPEKWKQLLNSEEYFNSYIIVNIAVKKEFELKRKTVDYQFYTQTEFVVDDKTKTNKISVRVNPNTNISGVTSLSILQRADFEVWNELRRSSYDCYTRRKNDFLEYCITVIEDNMGEIKSAIQHTDVATPATIHRHTLNRYGSAQGFLPTPSILKNKIPKKADSLENLYLTGHWTYPGGGLVTGFLSGRWVAQLICAQRNQNFVIKEWID